jgi:gamma-glutamyltranspeptidase/glutathione hydrolase
MSDRKGVVAAGHPLTAEAGARILREGGNAVDAAICAVLTSFVCESQLTGFGAGGFMMVHEGGEDTLIDFFVAAGGADGAERSAELLPVPVYFDETPQTFNCGAASCGVPGTPAGLERVWRRFGSVPLERLARPGIELGRNGVVLTAEAEYFHQILHPILISTPESAALYTPEGRQLVAGDTFHYPEMADALERFAARGSEPFYRGETAQAVCDWVRERGGTLGIDDMAAYEPIERLPVRASFRGHDVLTNPPPSSGGILIGYSLGLLERLGRSGVEEIVAASEAANARRSDDFHEGLHDEEYVRRFLASDLDAAAGRIRGGDWAGGHGGAGGPDHPEDRLGSTTHIAVLDADVVAGRPGRS